MQAKIPRWKRSLRWKIAKLNRKWIWHLPKLRGMSKVPEKMPRILLLQSLLLHANRPDLSEHLSIAFQEILPERNPHDWRYTKYPTVLKFRTETTTMPSDTRKWPRVVTGGPAKNQPTWKLIAGKYVVFASKVSFKRLSKFRRCLESRQRYRLRISRDQVVPRSAVTVSDNVCQVQAMLSPGGVESSSAKSEPLLDQVYAPSPGGASLCWVGVLTPLWPDST